MSTRSEHRRPRIIITYPYPLGKASGGARMTREIGRHLGKLGAEVALVPVSSEPNTLWPRPTVSEGDLGLEFDEELGRDSVHVVRVPQHPLHWRLDALQVRRAVERLLAAGRVDAVLSYYHEAAFLPSLLRSRGVRFGFIATWQSFVEGRVVPRPRGALRGRIYDWLYRRTIAAPYHQGEIVFATSAFTAHEVAQEMGVDPDRIVLTYLGVDPQFFRVPRRPPASVRNLLFVGRVVPQKGVADVMQALGRLAREGIGDWSLRVVGMGLHDWARKAAAEAGIADRVEVAGPFADEELCEELARADLAILPSHFEAFGLCFAEAMAAGLPIVAYHAGSVPELVEDCVTGWLAPLKDVDALASCVRRALADPRATYEAGLRGRERTSRLFTWPRTAAIILQGLHRLDPGRFPEPAVRPIELDAAQGVTT